MIGIEPMTPRDVALADELATDFWWTACAGWFRALVARSGRVFRCGKRRTAGGDGDDHALLAQAVGAARRAARVDPIVTLRCE